MTISGGQKLALDVVNWSEVDQVWLDMDGTLLDLAFDNDFWGRRIHEKYAAQNDMGYSDVVAQFEPLFESVKGTLSWYSTDFWSQQYGFDLIAYSRDYEHNIGWLPYAESFLASLREKGVPTVILTNAHPDIVTLKHKVTGICDKVDKTISSHDVGFAKEHPSFWDGIFAATQASSSQLSGQRILFFDDSSAVIHAAIRAGVIGSVMMCSPDTTKPNNPPKTELSIHYFQEIWPNLAKSINN